MRYALNNPLVYTDPDGEWLAFVIGFVVGAYIGGSAVNNDWSPWNGGWDFSDPATYFGIIGGGLAGGLGAQWVFGPGGVLAGGTPLNVSLGASLDKVGAVFANISIGGGSGVTLETLGYATAGGGGGLMLWNSFSSPENVVNQEIAQVRQDYGAEWRATSGGDINTYRIYGNDISISNSIEIGSTRLSRDALYIYDKDGVLSAVSSQGIPYRGQDIIKFMVQQKVNSTNSWKALSKLFQNEPYNDPYNGEYKGLGLGGSALGLPHESGLWLMDYLNWIQNNPEEVKKMQAEYYYFLKRIQGE